MDRQEEIILGLLSVSCEMRRGFHKILNGNSGREKDLETLDRAFDRADASLLKALIGPLTR